MAALPIFLAIALTVALLWSVRLNFTGYSYDGTLVQKESHASLALPAFSDEWVIAGFVQKTAERGGLPNFHPLDSSIPPAENMLAPLVMLLALVMKVTGVDIVTHYFAYAFAFQALFVLAFYAFMRACRISRPASLIGLCMLLLLPASNIMSGIWIMLPSYIGIIFLMIAYACLAKRNAIAGFAFDGNAAPDIQWRRTRKAWSALGFASLLIGCVIYPPFLMLASIYAVWFFIKNSSYVWLGIFLIALAAIAFGFIKIVGVPMHVDNIIPFWHSFSNVLIHSRFGVSTAAVWTYVPVLFYICAISGLFLWFAKPRNADQFGEKSIIGYCIFACVALLVLPYCFDREFVLGHQRAVFILWIIMIAMASYALERMAKRVLKADVSAKETGKGRTISALTNAAIGAIILVQCIVLFSNAYPSMPRWQGIATIADPMMEQISATPVMTNMLPVDFEKTIDSVLARYAAGQSTAHASKRPALLSEPHLALAISATTDMAPVSTVDSIVSVAGPSYTEFAALESCDQKYAFMKKNAATHVLIHDIEGRFVAGCNRFAHIADLKPHYLLYEFR